MRGIASIIAYRNLTRVSSNFKWDPGEACSSPRCCHPMRTIDRSLTSVHSIWATIGTRPLRTGRTNLWPSQLHSNTRIIKVWTKCCPGCLRKLRLRKTGTKVITYLQRTLALLSYLRLLAAAMDSRWWTLRGLIRALAYWKMQITPRAWARSNSWRGKKSLWRISNTNKRLINRIVLLLMEV